MMQGLMMSSALTVTSILRHATRWHGEAEIVSRRLDGGIHRYTYADFGRRVHQLANALTDLGIKPGDRVATLAWNGWRHLEIYYAVSALGAVCHTINPRLFPEQITYIANHAQDVVLCFDLTFAPLVARLAPNFATIRHYIPLCGSDEAPHMTLPGLVAYETLIQDASSEFDWPELDENTASALCYTSGTTGNPRGVLYSHRSTVLHAMSCCHPDSLGLCAADAVMPVVPMFHANAWGIPYAGLISGSKLVMPGHAMDGASLHQLLEDEQVTMTAGVPTVWIELLRHLNDNGLKLNHLRRVLVGGSAGPRSMIERFERDYGVTFIHGWGMTEMSPIGAVGVLKPGMAALSQDERWDIKTCQGRPPYGVDLRIVDAEGRDLPHDGASAGALMVRGPWVAAAYYEDPTGAVAFSDDGWFTTGDVGTITPAGFLRLTDRLKDVIKSGGEWISSIELENIAVGHPAVLEAAVIAVPHPKWQERPLLVVVPRPGMHIHKQEMLEYYKGKVASWWIPDDVVVADELPHTATGKLLKLKLRQIYKDYVLPTA